MLMYEQPQLPLPPHTKISKAQFLIVEEAMVVAWDLLRTQPPAGFDWAKADEDTITHHLRLILCNKVLNKRIVDGFNLDIFRVYREPKFANYLGKDIDKMPDLFVDIIGRPEVELHSDDGLFIECKPVDSTHTVGSCYCSEGLIRFVDGRYAWAMTEAMMVGYARSDYEIDPKKKRGTESLKQALNKKPSNITTKAGPSPCSRSKATALSEAVHVTQHDRKDDKGNPLIYKETGDKIPDITIRHLWLKRI